MTSNAPSDKVMAQAAVWYDSLNELSDADYDAFLDWLDASPDHQEAFNMLETTSLDPALLNAAVEIERALETAERSDQRQLSFVSHLLGVFERQRAAMIGGALACLALLVGLNTLELSGKPSIDIHSESYATLHGATSAHALVDGSNVTLNADSAIETDYTTEERRIVLKKGSAVFDVAHAPSRPFIVQVDNVTATALGTIYEVDRLESAVEVRVFEGVVRISRNGAVIQTVAAGQWLLIDDSETIRSGDLADTSSVDWMSGWMQTEQTELKHVVEKLNRYRDKPVRISSNQLKVAPITGRFSLRDSDATLQLIAALQGIEVVETPDETLLKSANSN